MKKRLERETNGKLLGGVITGLARYFDKDPALFRLLAVLLIIIEPTGAILAYLIAWFIIPAALTDVQVDYDSKS